VIRNFLRSFETSWRTGRPTLHSNIAQALRSYGGSVAIELGLCLFGKLDVRATYLKRALSLQLPGIGLMQLSGCFTALSRHEVHQFAKL
jgi:hypothetical protein